MITYLVKFSRQNKTNIQSEIGLSETSNLSHKPILNVEQNRSEIIVVVKRRSGRSVTYLQFVLPLCTLSYIYIEVQIIVYLLKKIV
jgi:hypothetical protein